MEVKMQTSFIPKKPIIESSSEGSGVSLFLLLSIIAFIVAVAMAGGVWLWQKSLVSQIEKDKIDLAAVKDSYEEGTINPLIRLNDRIEESKLLLSRHIAITPVFIFLEKNIIQNVQLKSLKFAYIDNTKINIELSGIAKDYDALSRQSDAFGAPHLRDYISEPVISDFNLNPDSTVSFSFKALINSQWISAEKILEKIE